MAGSELMRNHGDAMQTYQATKEDKDCDLVLGHLGLEPVGVHHRYDGRGSVSPRLQACNENCPNVAEFDSCVATSVASVQFVTKCAAICAAEDTGTHTRRHTHSPPRARRRATRQ